MGLGRILRPRNFTTASAARIGRFPCDSPLASLTHDLEVVNSMRHIIPNLISRTRRDIKFGANDGARTHDLRIHRPAL